MSSLRHANIAGVDFSRTQGLDQDQIDEACGDASTRLPPGLMARTCSRKVRFVVNRAPAPAVRAVPVHPAMPPAPPAPPAAPRYIVSND